MFALKDIQTNEEICKKYLLELPTNESFQKVIEHAHQLCPELKDYCGTNEEGFRGTKKKDKGSMVQKKSIINGYIFQCNGILRVFRNITLRYLGKLIIDQKWLFKKNL